MVFKPKNLVKLFCLDKFKIRSNAWLITYFGNFFFGFSSLRLHDFLDDIFRLQCKMGNTKRKINKLLRNTLVTLSPEKTKNEVTKMG